MMIELANFVPNVYNAILLIGAVLIIYFTIRRQLKSRRLKNLPGPEPISFLGNSLDLIKSKNIIEDFVQFSKKYGSPYKLWLGDELYVVLASAEHIETFFRTSKSNHKTDLFNKFKDVFGGSIFTSFGDAWKVKRKYLLRTMNGKRLRNFEMIFQNETNKFINELRTKQHNVIDLWNYLPYLAFNIVSKTNVNIDAEAPVSRNAFQFHHTMNEMFATNFTRIICPWYQNDYVAKCVHGLNISRHKSRLRQLARQVVSSFENKIEDSFRKTNAENEASYDDKNYAEIAYMLSKMTQQPNTFYDEILLSLSAGTMNISITLGFFLLAIAIHPEIQEKIYEEILRVIGNDETKLVDSDYLSKLTYFDQAFKETLRRFTLIPLILRKLECDFELEGNTIPAGTNIVVSVIDVHFNSKYYPDPWNFNPANFELELTNTRSKYAYLPFAAGPRDCLGKMYAILEMKMILVNLMRVFKFSTTMNMEDIKLNYSFLVTNSSGYHVKIEERT